MTPRRSPKEKPRGPDIPADVVHERFAKLHGAYTGFIAAAIIGLVSGGENISSATWAVSFWTLSLPPLVALLLIDFVVRVRQRREKSATRGAMGFLGYGLSNLGTGALLTHYSWIAAIFYFLLILFCLFILQEVCGLGWYKGYEDF